MLVPTEPLSMDTRSQLLRVPFLLQLQHKSFWSCFFICSPALCSLSYQSLVDTECHILMTKVHLPSKMFRITRDVINVQCTKSLIDTEMFSQYSSSAVTETYIVLFTNQHKNTKIQYVQKKQLIILNSFQNNKHKI